MAALIASSASIEQWSFTGGSLRWEAISVFLILMASSMFIPFFFSQASYLYLDSSKKNGKGLFPVTLPLAPWLPKAYSSSSISLETFL